MPKAIFEVIYIKYKFIKSGVCAPKGFKAAGIHAGIRKNKDKKDLAAISAEDMCTAAAVYTKNLVKGAPLIVTERHLANGRARMVICNSGNANTCNADGEQKAIDICVLAAKAAGIAPEDIIVASTGVIGQTLPLEPFERAMPELIESLSEDGGEDAAEAILTTDTKTKEYAVEFEIAGDTARIGGIAKGSGMIHPNMATMLCFLTTDAAVSAEMLQKALREAADESFNLVSV
ncbi:MAG TPA: arginine biosynthesis protein ArgJ, partial [Ruminococcaceae bacterium]|nr:arginine biosynthesis protein ArgJ [Oscillospiraceae bacterium]